MSYDLWALLPGHQRIADAERGYPLRTLLDIVSQQANVLDTDIGQLYNDLFIETCQEWVIPYLGALIGNIPLQPVPGGARADVARTLSFRRRKGTVPMLGTLAGFVTGHPARAVAFFDTMAWTQNLNHLRPGIGTVDLRNSADLGHLGTGFNTVAHTADLRPWQDGGRFSIPRIGFFISRLGSYRLASVTAREASGHPGCYYFSPLGRDTVLFNPADAPAPSTIPGPAVQAPESALSGVLRHDMFHHETTGYYPYQPAGAADPGGLGVFVNDVRIGAERVCCMNLSGWALPEAAGISVGIDVQRGRLAFAAAEAPAPGDRVQTSHAYGFAADIGGGPYPRPHLFNPPVPINAPTVLQLLPGGIEDSLLAWSPGPGDSAVLEIPDNTTLTAPAPISLGGPGLSLVLRAANGKRPLLRADLIAGPDGPEHLVLDGLLIEGRLEVAPHSRLRTLTLLDCTLVPGLSLSPDGEPVSPDAPSLAVGEGNGELDITLQRCITGTLLIPDSIDTLRATDCIIDHPGHGDPETAGPALAGSADGAEPGPPTFLERCTVFGAIHVRELDGASDCLLTAPVRSDRRQQGCIRFSYLAPGSSTGGPYRCQPAEALRALNALSPGADPSAELRRLVPAFTSRRYGDPGYAQLADATATEIRTGASNRSEMGAFNLVREPQRTANLSTRLTEYLPFGLEPGFIYTS